MDQVKIGKFIASLRKEKRITQNVLAESLGVTNRSISKWETGKCMPDYSLIHPLCEILEITPNDLLAGEIIKSKDYENKTNENIDDILKEYYKMKKQKKIIKNILIIISALFLIFIIRFLFIIGIVSLSFLSPNDIREGVEKYDKNYYIEKYGSDLDSNLMIFPDSKDKMIEPYFESSLQTNFFDSDGYIILVTKYDEEVFNEELDRLSSIEMTIGDCVEKEVTNYVEYDANSYEHPAYITIDGFASTYEYALIDEDNLTISYIYLSYPSINNKKYKAYLKKKKNEYLKLDNLDNYSLYNHSFDNGSSWIEYNDCSV